MNNENKKVSEFNSEDYKNLPIEMRTMVNMTANELLEIQRKNKALVEGEESLPSHDDGKNME
jgi:hypothetical protein